MSVAHLGSGLTRKVSHERPQDTRTPTDARGAHSLDRMVKRGDAHLFDLAAGCVFVIGMVAEKPQMPLTVWMR